MDFHNFAANKLKLNVQGLIILQCILVNIKELN